MDYRNTLNLPKTAFPMKANLPVAEPQRLAQWEALDIYGALRRARQGQPKFVLHDGPPYANGDIHAGTALNKIVKDMINRYWALAGRDVAYVPGFDTHGLPIEMRALKALGVSQHQIAPLDLRRECAGVARHYIGVMTTQFQRLGVMGDWKHPYATLNPAYEAEELRVFADMVDQGLIYRDLKSVYWCPHCETALAEGEIEYKTHASPSIYVAFPVEETDRLPSGTRAVIWTTTPWTIPANVAIAVHPSLHYVVVKTEAGPLLLAEALVEKVLALLGLHNQGSGPAFPGSALEGLVARHPYLDRTAPFVLGDHVTAESGTGLVHTAPGHGIEDFEVGRRYQLPVIQPLDDQGYYRPDTPLVAGLFYEAANPVVIEKLTEVGALLHQERYDHQYPFCWRCKNPIIFRATSQWFLSIDRIRDQLTEATYTVHWDPQWGGDRMRGMVEDREDWCLSRQRVWGLPIPAFYCLQCGSSILTGDLVRHVADIIAREGSDSWWAQPAAYFLPEGFRCPTCGGHEFRQERDIFDVWMDSGSSHAAVLKGHPDLRWPADLVLEGNDQYRGWFNSLLTTGIATQGEAPYRMVLTHGMVLDQFGQEMHKSLGNTVDPLELVERYGSDVLRLWVASSDFRTDVRISDDLMKQLAESYRKIRNTFRFMLGNLADFSPATAPGQGALHDPLNRWVVFRVGQWLEEAQAAYQTYQFHAVVHGLVRLMTVDLSSLYLDIIKDRLYTLGRRDPLRQETQTVLYYVLHALLRAIAPVLVFTADEIYEFAPKPADFPHSVHLCTWVGGWDIGYNEAERARMDRLFGYREVILKAIEEKRAAKILGNSLAARVVLHLPAGENLSRDDQGLLTELVMAAEIVPVTGDILQAVAEPTDWARCERCWRHTPDVSEDDHLCERCRGVLAQSVE